MAEGIRGDYFTDRLGGWTEALLAAVSIGIVVSRHSSRISDLVLGALYALEVVGAVLITRSKLPLMKAALWLFTFRVAAGVAYMGVIHGDKLARSTLGFPVVVAIYCFCRGRALRDNP